MKNTCFGTVYCIRLQNNFFKLILPYIKPINESIPVLIKNKDMRKMEKEILRMIGFLAGSCVRKGMLVGEIEIILPPNG